MLTQQTGSRLRALDKIARMRNKNHTEQDANTLRMWNFGTPSFLKRIPPKHYKNIHLQLSNKASCNEYNDTNYFNPHTPLT